ncbi:hypothetical protein N9D06_01765 [Candidatus Pelagibacter sp.]|nr:hypothetical protein [Candidatus Pelagibacter sp.]
MKINDKVILTWIKSKDINVDTYKFLNKNKIINSGKVIIFSKYSIVSENRVVSKLLSLSDKYAPMYGCAF